jgi:hypothetical protein
MVLSLKIFLFPFSDFIFCFLYSTKLAMSSELEQLRVETEQLKNQIRVSCANMTLKMIHLNA